MSKILEIKLEPAPGMTNVSYKLLEDGSLQVTLIGEPQTTDDDQHARRFRELRNILQTKHGLELLEKLGVYVETQSDTQKLILPSPVDFKRNFSLLQLSIEIAFFSGGRFSSQRQITELATRRASLFSLDANVYAHDILDHAIGWLLLDKKTIDSIISKAERLQYADQKSQDSFAGAIDRITSELLSSLTWNADGYSAWLIAAKDHFAKIMAGTPIVEQLSQRRDYLLSIITNKAS